MMLIQAQSAGFQTGDFAIIKINNKQHMFKANDKGTYRGMHVCILNGKTGNVMWSEIFDTYHSSDAFEYFCSCELVEEGQIVIAACRDDAAKNLSNSVRQWFKDMGSKEIFNLKYRESFVFIGQYGRTQAYEKRGSTKVPVQITQAFVAKGGALPEAVNSMDLETDESLSAQVKESFPGTADAMPGLFSFMNAPMEDQVRAYR